MNYIKQINEYEVKILIVDPTVQMRFERSFGSTDQYVGILMDLTDPVLSELVMYVRIDFKISPCSFGHLGPILSLVRLFYNILDRSCV